MKNSKSFNMIKNTIEPLREEAVGRMIRMVQNKVDSVLEHLEQNDWDVNQAYPNDTKTCFNLDTRSEEQTAHYKFARSITKIDTNRPTNNKINAPIYVVAANDKIQYHIDTIRKMANETFDAYLVKLFNKIGDHDDIKNIYLDEEHYRLWDFSYLYVEWNDGNRDKWKTQIITKMSHLGTIFNQWPTRKVK